MGAPLEELNRQLARIVLNAVEQLENTATPAVVVPLQLRVSEDACDGIRIDLEAPPDLATTPAAGGRPVVGPRASEKGE